jgi:hypothetical protein
MWVRPELTIMGSTTGWSTGFGALDPPKSKGLTDGFTTFDRSTVTVACGLARSALPQKSSAQSNLNVALDADPGRREDLWREGWERGDGVRKTGRSESALHGSIENL